MEINIDQNWFEFQDKFFRNHSRSTWVPLRLSKTISSDQNTNEPGFFEDSFYSASVAVPRDQANAFASSTTFSDLVPSWTCRPFFRNDTFFRSDDYTKDERTISGHRLIIEQYFNSAHSSIWHIAQDFILAYNLIKDGDNWLSTENGYSEVLKVTDEKNNKEILVQAEYLKDYLCCRDLSLIVSSFRRRIYVDKEPPKFLWDNCSYRREENLTKVLSQTFEVTKNGHLSGSSSLLVKMSRNNVDTEEDVPLLGEETSTNTDIESKTIQHDGATNFKTMGDFWKTEIIQPSSHSFMLREDTRPPIDIKFIAEADGTTFSSEELRPDECGRWLWFNPEVINALLAKKHSSLNWHTRQTGTVFGTPDYGTWFGINERGLITVYASDVADKPEWLQVIWKAHNVIPDGGISKELADAQIHTTPTGSLAPEAHIENTIKNFENILSENFDCTPMREHKDVPIITLNCHRFRAVENNGLYSLAKDLHRLFIERINETELKKIAKPPKKQNLKSIKLLELLLSYFVTTEQARRITAPLVGINELRMMDAHLPTSKIEPSLKLAQVPLDAPPPLQGENLIRSFVGTVHEINRVLHNVETKDIPLP